MDFSGIKVSQLNIRYTALQSAFFFFLINISKLHVLLNISSKCVQLVFLWDILLKV